MAMQKTDKLASAKQQGQAQFDSIREMVEWLSGWIEYEEGQDVTPPDRGQSWWYHKNAPDGDWFNSKDEALDAARQAIEEDALSIEVRTGWYSPGARDPDTKPAAYRILLCTGGPAVQIIGELSKHGEPETARMQVQDWFQPWTDFRPQVGPDDYDSEPILLAYAQCFCFGE